jgi:hypothetical protein
MAFAGPNDSVAKGPVTICLDQMSVQANARARLEALRQAVAALAPDNFLGLEQAFAQHLFPGFFSSDQIYSITNYLGQYWFNETTGWWPTFQPIAPIYATGLLTTLNLSLAAKEPLRIDSYWILNHSQVELINLATAHHVTLLICTPQPIERPPSGMWSEESQAWVTTRRSGITPGEVNPVTNSSFSSGGPESRVRTYRIQVRSSKGA